MYHRWVAHLCCPNNLRCDHTPMTEEYTSHYHSGTHLLSKSGQLLTKSSIGMTLRTCTSIFFFFIYSLKTEMSIVMKDICRKRWKLRPWNLPQKSGFSSLLSPQLLKPSHRLLEEMQMLVVSHFTKPGAQVLSAIKSNKYVFFSLLQEIIHFIFITPTKENLVQSLF